MNKNIAFIAIVSLILGLGAIVVNAADLTVVIDSPISGQDYVVNQPITFHATASGGDITNYSYNWNFADETFGIGPNYTKTYTATGTRDISVTVTDFSGTQLTVSKQINIIAAVTTAAIPTLDLKVNGGNGPVTIATSTAFTLSWISTDATACTASGAWSGDKATSNTGATMTSPSTPSTAQTYTITCTGAGGTANDSVTVNTTAATGDSGPVAPVITNVRITDITAHSLIVRWETDKAADSRVIYDTVSHPSLAGQTEPNFGYAHSTDTVDGTTKVTAHAVTVSGLTPSTTYFFRVLSR